MYLPMSDFMNGPNGVVHDHTLHDELMKVSSGLPLAALNERRSAHFLEINSIYSAEMARRVSLETDLSSRTSSCTYQMKEAICLQRTKQQSTQPKDTPTQHYQLQKSSLSKIIRLNCRSHRTILFFYEVRLN